MSNKISLKDWDEALEARVGIDLYVYGGNGQSIIVLLPKVCNMEKSLNDVDRVLTLLAKRLEKGIDIKIICGEDCSGLAVKILVPLGILPYDMTANSIYNYIVGTDEIKAHGKKISLDEVQNGDYLFEGTSSNKHHIGYAINSEYAIESKSHDEGVVKTKISERKWTHAARPNWYLEEPEPIKYVLTRELYLTSPYMTGDDVKEVQKRLNELDYNCGLVDGIFGNKTKIAVANFQTDAKLDIQRLGTVGKKTAEALGFEWEG